MVVDIAIMRARVSSLTKNESSALCSARSPGAVESGNHGTLE